MLRTLRFTCAGNCFTPHRLNYVDCAIIKISKSRVMVVNFTCKYDVVEVVISR